MQHIIKHYTCNLRVNTTTLNHRAVKQSQLWLHVLITSGSFMGRFVHHVLLQCFFPPPGSHFLDHILTTACNEKERFMALISMFCARLTFNCGHSAAEESIKETCEIDEKLTCIILGAISACPWLWLLGLFNNTGVSVRLLWFACTLANVISFLPPSCRTVSSL